MNIRFDEMNENEHLLEIKKFGNKFKNIKNRKHKFFFLNQDARKSKKVRGEIYLSLDVEKKKSGFWEYKIPRSKKKEKTTRVL